MASPIFFPPVIPTFCRCTSFSYWEVWWHLSALRLSIYSSVFPRCLLFPRLPSRILFVILFSNILGICPARFIIWTCVYVTQSVSVHSLYSALLHRIFQTPFYHTGPDILRSIFLSKEPIICETIGKRLLFTPKQKISSDMCFVRSNPVLRFEVFCFKRNAK